MRPVRPCAVCESDTTNIRYCSRACQQKAGVQAPGRTKILIKCVQCATETSNQKFCSRSCAATYNGIAFPKRKRQRPSRFCAKCGAESIYRKYCAKCSDNGRIPWQQLDYEILVERWLDGSESGTASNGHSARDFVRRYLIETYGEKCQECEWAKVSPWTGRIPVQLEHRDGDRSNNRPENVELICGACHTLTKTYAAGNSNANRIKRGEVPLTHCSRGKRAKYDK